MPQENWLISGILLDGKGGARRLNEDEINRWKPADGLLWVHLNLASSEAVQWLEQKAGLDEWAIQTLSDKKESRPRTIVHQDALLLVLRTVNLTPRSQPDDMVFLRLWATKERMITVRIHPAISFKEIMDDFTQNSGPRDINALIQTVLENTLDSTADTVSDMEDQVDAMEEKIITRKPYPALFDDLSELMRQLVIMHRFLSPERDALDALTRKETPWFNKGLERSSKDSFNRMQRIIEDIVLLRERVRINQEALNQHDAKKSQKNMYILSIIATIFLPMSFMASLLGMNVGGIPFASAPYGLAASFIIIVFIAGILAFIFRKLKWF